MCDYVGVFVFVFLGFIVFLIFGPNAIRSIYIRKMSDEYYAEDNANSLNETAGNLIAKYIYLHKMNTSIDVQRSLLDGDSYYDVQRDEINIGEEIDRSMNIYAVTECYHELGHARQMQKFNNPRRKLQYIESLKKKRTSMPYLSLIGMICLVFGLIGIMVMENTPELFLISTPLGAIFIGWMVHLQIEQVKDEAEASNFAIQMMAEDGFTSLEIEKAQKRLDKCLKTYKMELVINSLKWLGIVLLMICTSGCGKKDNKRRK